MAKFLNIAPLFLIITIYGMASTQAQKCNCGKKEVKKMEKINLKDTHGNNIVLYKDKDIIGDGSYFTKVYHAMQINGNAHKCVALKFSLIGEEKKGGKQRSISNKEKEKKENMKKQKLNQEKEWRNIDALKKVLSRKEYENAFIQIIAKGTYKKQKEEKSQITEIHYFTIMELGSIDYYEYLKNEFDYYDDKDDEMTHEILKEFIRQPAAVMSSMHKVLVHLDIKPENFLYTKFDNKLKAIDFGGSLVLPYGEKSSNKSAVRGDRLLPNYPMKIYTDNLSITDTYACPEMYTDFYDAKGKEYTVVTAKCDIWAVGVMIYEMALSDVRYDLVGRKYSNGDKMVDSNVDRMGTFFKDLIREKYSKNYLFKEWDDIWSILRRILRVREYFPKIFHLMMACLNKNPIQRPTAKGIVDFLDGKCHFASELLDASNDQMEVAPFMTLGQLKKELREMIVEKEKRIKKFLEEESKDRKKSKKIEEELEIVEECKNLLEVAELPYDGEKPVGGQCEVGEQVANMNEILDSFKNLRISTDTRKKSKDRSKSGRKSSGKSGKSGGDSVNISGNESRKQSVDGQKPSMAEKQSGKQKKMSNSRKQSSTVSRKSTAKRKSRGKKAADSVNEHNLKKGKSSGHRKSHSEHRSGVHESSDKRRPSEGHKSSGKRHLSEGHKSFGKRHLSEGHKSSGKRHLSEGHKSSGKRRLSKGHKSSGKRRPSEHRSSKSTREHKGASMGKNGGNNAKMHENSGHSSHISLQHHKELKALSEHDSRSNHRGGKLSKSSHRSH